MEEFGPWHQAVALQDGRTTPGKWKAREMTDFILANAPWVIRGRVLDAGGNAGGIAIELQNDVDEAVVLESSQVYAKQFQYISQYRPVEKVRFVNDSLFTAHKMGRFDVVLALGLIYHFRYPQMFLDYCASLECDHFVFSTQTRHGDEKTLWNRSQIPAYEGRGLLGWHPSRPAFHEMLEASGFNIDEAVAVKDVSFTNDYYVFARLTSRRVCNQDAISSLSREHGFWS